MNFYIQNENPHLFGYAHAPPATILLSRVPAVIFCHSESDGRRGEGRCAAGRRVVKWRGLALRGWDMIVNTSLLCFPSAHCVERASRRWVLLSFGQLKFTFARTHL